MISRTFVPASSPILVASAIAPAVIDRDFSRCEARTAQIFSASVVSGICFLLRSSVLSVSSVVKHSVSTTERLRLHRVARPAPVTEKSLRSSSLVRTDEHERVVELHV